MVITNPEDARRHLEALALANRLEVEELRATPIELKLKQIWSLMSAARLLDNDARRYAEATEIRERWDRYYAAKNA